MRALGTIDHILLADGHCTRSCFPDFPPVCRANAQQPRLFVGMLLILIFAEVLALYGLIGALLMTKPAILFHPRFHTASVRNILLALSLKHIQQY